MKAARAAIVDRDLKPSNMIEGVEVVRRELDNPLRERDLVTFLAKLVEQHRRSGRTSKP